MRLVSALKVEEDFQRTWREERERKNGRRFESNMNGPRESLGGWATNTKACVVGGKFPFCIFE